jgi:hypothetical protein
MILFITTALAESMAEVGVLTGVRGNAESTLEQPQAVSIANLEPSATVAVLGEVHMRWTSGFWLATSGEAWTYIPEADPTLLRAVPAIGGTFNWGTFSHIDAAARYGFEALPLRTGRTNGRAEATAKVGLDFGAHRLDVIALGVSRDWFDLPAWSFRTAEAGLSWEWQPSAFRLGARVTGQYNTGWTINTTHGLDAATGEQLHLGASGGWTSYGWDISLEYRLYLADEGNVEDAARPQFTPVGDYDDDADALSAGGFTQHRLGLSLSGSFAEVWTLNASLLARLRLNEPHQITSVLSRTFHTDLNIGRSIGGPWSVHGVVGLTTLDLPDGEASYDPSAWLMLQWALKGK